ETLRDAVHIDLLADSDVLAAVAETNVKRSRLENVVDEGTLSLVIDGNAPIGAYQVLVRFDPTAIQFSPDDILGGSADGFTSDRRRCATQSISIFWRTPTSSLLLRKPTSSARGWRTW